MRIFIISAAMVMGSLSAWADTPYTCDDFDMKGYYEVEDVKTKQVHLTRIKKIHPKELWFTFEVVKSMGRSYVFDGTLRGFAKWSGLSNLTLKTRMDSCQVYSYGTAVGNTEVWTIEDVDADGNLEVSIQKDGAPLQVVFRRRSDLILP